MLRNILFQLLALISNIVTPPWRQARFHTVWTLFETSRAFKVLARPRPGGRSMPFATFPAIFTLRRQSQLADCWGTGRLLRF